MCLFSRLFFHKKNVQGFKGREKPSVGKSFMCIDLLKPRHKV